MKLFDIARIIHRVGGSNVEFLVHDIDESGDPKYYGFAAPDGGFIVMEVTNDTAYRYYIGRGTYEAAWTGRAALSYDYVYNLL